MLFCRVDDAAYEPSVGLLWAAWVSVFAIALTTAAAFKVAFGDATWGVSTGIGACMAAGVFEISRPERMSASRKAVLDAQFADFVQFAEGRLQRTGSCHESEVFAAFRTEVEGYRNPENTSDLTLRRFVQQWAPQSKRTSKGFLKKLSVKPRLDPFQ